MNRLTKEMAERIRARVHASLDEPSPLADPLVERLQDYQETLWFFETWVAWLEARLRLAGIDPMDMWDSPPNNGERMKQIEPKFLGVDDAEARTGLSRWTWRRMAYQGRIASTKVGKRLLIPIAEIDRILAEGYRPALTTKN